MGLAKKTLTSQARGNRKFYFGWGFNNVSRLGVGDLLSKSSPTIQGTSLLQTWNKVYVGKFTTTGINSSWSIAIDSRGLLYSWGINSSGQLGRPINRSSPVQIGTSSWTAVAGGFQHSLALRQDGLLFAWGYNTNGQLGDGTVLFRQSP